MTQAAARSGCALATARARPYRPPHAKYLQRRLGMAGQDGERNHAGEHGRRARSPGPVGDAVGSQSSQGSHAATADSGCSSADDAERINANATAQNTLAISPGRCAARRRRASPPARTGGRARHRAPRQRDRDGDPGEGRQHGRLDEAKNGCPAYSRMLHSGNMPTANASATCVRNGRNQRDVGEQPVADHQPGRTAVRQGKMSYRRSPCDSARPWSHASTEITTTAATRRRPPGGAMDARRRRRLRSASGRTGNPDDQREQRGRQRPRRSAAEYRDGGHQPLDRDPGHAPRRRSRERSARSARSRWPSPGVPGRQGDRGEQRPERARAGAAAIRTGPSASTSTESTNTPSGPKSPAAIVVIDAKRTVSAR